MVGRRLAPERGLDRMTVFITKLDRALVAPLAGGLQLDLSDLLHSDDDADDVDHQRHLRLGVVAGGRLLETFELRKVIDVALKILHIHVVMALLNLAADIEGNAVVVGNRSELLVGELDLASAHHVSVPLLKLGVELHRGVFEEGRLDLVAAAVHKVDAEQGAAAARIVPLAELVLLGDLDLDGPVLDVCVQAVDWHIVLVEGRRLRPSGVLVGSLLLTDFQLLHGFLYLVGRISGKGIFKVRNLIEAIRFHFVTALVRLIFRDSQLDFTLESVWVIEVLVVIFG